MWSLYERRDLKGNAVPSFTASDVQDKHLDKTCAGIEDSKIDNINIAIARTHQLREHLLYMALRSLFSVHHVTLCQQMLHITVNTRSN